MRAPEGYRTFRDGALLGLALEGREGEVCSALAASVESWKEGGPTSVGVFRAPGGAALVAKRYRRGGAGRIRRSLVAAAALERHGVATPRVVGAVLPGRGRGGALVTEAVPGAVGLDRHAAALPGGRPTAALVEALALAVRGVHRAGWRHGDLKAANLLVAPCAPGVGPRVWLVDLDSARPLSRFGPIARRQVARDLAALAWSLRGWPRWTAGCFLRAYTPGSSREATRRLRRPATARMRTRIARRGAAARRVLVVRLSALGDVVHATPAVRALRGLYPGAHLAWAVDAEAAPLALGADERIPLPRRRWARAPLDERTVNEARRWVAALRRRRFDLAVDLQGLARSALVAFLSGARSRVGASSAREGARLLYTHIVPLPTLDEHAVRRGMRVVADLGGVPPESLEVAFLAPGDPAAARGSRRLPGAGGLEPGGYLVAAVGAGKPANRWPASRWGELAALVHGRTGLCTILVGGPSDRALGAEAMARAGPAALDLVGRTGLGELSELLRGAAAVVASDTGTLHLAVACARPTVALFGPASAARTGPYRGGRVVSLGLPCAPCFADLRCPLVHHRCMDELPVARVLEAVLEAVLEGAVGRASPRESGMARTA
ncbi:MAG: hypothetical protein HY722_02865 [Planctomycetes bacterium]|nr:hypothetical protein [Planctomycetota bacterium]